MSRLTIEFTWTIILLKLEGSKGSRDSSLPCHSKRHLMPTMSLAPYPHKTCSITIPTILIACNSFPCSRFVIVYQQLLNSKLENLFTFAKLVVISSNIFLPGMFVKKKLFRSCEPGLRDLLYLQNLN